MPSFKEYINALKTSNVSYVYLVELLDAQETQSTPLWIDVYDSEGTLRINLKDSTRRTINITLDNSTKKYNIDVNKLWIYQKLRFSMGIEYINNDNGESEIFLVPQGVFYITNPNEIYDADLKTINIECIDKWGRLNGRLGGKLEGTYTFPKNYTDDDGVDHSYEYNMYEIIRNILKTPLRTDIRNIIFIPEINEGTQSEINSQINNFLTQNNVELTEIKRNEAITDNKTGSVYYCNNYPSKSTNGISVYPIWAKLNIDKNEVIDNLEPLLHHWYVDSEDALHNIRVLMPYSITQEIGKNYEDIIMEIAKILGASVYYDNTGRFVLEPTNENSGYLQDYDKEIVWTFNEDDKLLYNIGSEVFDFENIYNTVVAKGTITGVGSYTVLVKNVDPTSPISVERIGTKTIVYPDISVYNYLDIMKAFDVTKEVATDMVKDMLVERAKTLLKQHSSLISRTTIKCAPIPHLDVDKVIEVIKNGVSKRYLINSIDVSLNATESMTLEVVSLSNLQKTLVIK